MAFWPAAVRSFASGGCRVLFPLPGVLGIGAHLASACAHPSLHTARALQASLFCPPNETRDVPLKYIRRHLPNHLPPVARSYVRLVGSGVCSPRGACIHKHRYESTVRHCQDARFPCERGRGLHFYLKPHVSDPCVNTSYPFERSSSSPACFWNGGDVCLRS